LNEIDALNYRRRRATGKDESPLDMTLIASAIANLSQLLCCLNGYGSYNVQALLAVVPGDFYEGKGTDPNRIVRDYIDRGRSECAGRYSCRPTASNDC
jgi:hypothetical protein